MINGFLCITMNEETIYQNIHWENFSEGIHSISLVKGLWLQKNENYKEYIVENDLFR